jgi:protein-S-isoprenylcysteine O-methyltransferase Ste14
MKQEIRNIIIHLSGILGLLLVSVIAHAQDKEINTEEVKSWLEQNWIWVAGAVILLILIMLLSRGKKTNGFSGTRKTTTVVRDNDGLTKSVTTIEEKL